MYIAYGINIDNVGSADFHDYLLVSVTRRNCVLAQFLAGWGKGLPILRGEFLVRVMPRSPARFRLSSKDHKTRTGLKVELIEAPGLWGERMRPRRNRRSYRRTAGMMPRKPRRRR
jgi:hypothetical protein